MTQENSTIQKFINLVYEIFADEPEAYGLEGRIKLAKKLMADLEATE